MHNRKRKRSHRITRARPGAAPGTLVADPSAPKSTVQVLCYSPDQLIEQPLTDVRELPALLARWPVVWINVEGLGDADLIARLGETLHLHRLALEDVLNLHQRAKVEQYDTHLFIVAQMVAAGPPPEAEQVSLFLGQNHVVTFQEGRPGDCFEPLRQRIRGAVGRIRQAGADYLAYSLLDAVIDGYFPILEVLGERLETLEEEILARPDRRTISTVHEVKRDLVALRRVVWPLREALNTLVRDESALVTPETRVYLRDCYDHAVRIIDFVETYRELGADLTDLYLSSVSQRLNEVMKVLTVFTAVFIPLTLIAGIYGMNFNTQASPWNMPELNWLCGYPFALSLMALVAGGLLLWFRRKGWLGSGPARDDQPPDRDRPT
jgi:magnesium transporter